MAKIEDSREIISRKDAMAQGLKWFFTGIPCRYGHLSVRQVSNLSCYFCVKIRAKRHREENLEWHRERERIWRLKNLEGARAKDRRMYAKHGEKIKKRHREQYAKNPEFFKERAKIYNKKNSVAILRRARSSAASYRERFPEKAKAAIDLWWSKNPEKKKTYHRNRKARKLGNGGAHTREDVLNIIKYQSGKCAYCQTILKVGKYHVDHIMPLARGGSNDRRNLQVLCVPCNLQKQSSDPIDYARSLGKLI